MTQTSVAYGKKLDIIIVPTYMGVWSVFQTGQLEWFARNLMRAQNGAVALICGLLTL